MRVLHPTTVRSKLIRLPRLRLAHRTVAIAAHARTRSASTSTHRNTSFEAAPLMFTSVAHKELRCAPALADPVEADAMMVTTTTDHTWRLIAHRPARDATCFGLIRLGGHHIEPLGDT